MKRGSRSLNDLTELEDEGATLLPNPPVRASWSFSNLLPTATEQIDPNGFPKARLPTRTSKRPHSLLDKFQHRLAEQVSEALIAANRQNSERSLEDLFFNISSTVPQKTAQKLNLDMDRRWFYYELLATHYYACEKESPGVIAETVLPLCSRLWSLEHFPAIFALLLHRWLVETPSGITHKGWVMHFNVFFKGAYQLFWFDVEHETHKLWPLFIRLRDNMFAGTSRFFASPNPLRGRANISFSELSFIGSRNGSFSSIEDTVAAAAAAAHSFTGSTYSSHSAGALENIRKDFACVLSRFYYYYSTRPERVGNFCINQLQLEEGLDAFVPQLVRMLRAIRNENILRRYLRCTAQLPIESLSISSRNKLYATLNELQLPGAPLHPTAKITEQAEATMNQLFPQGRWTRSAINFFFRLLRPLYLPGSIFAFFTSFFQRAPPRQPHRKSI